MLKRPAPKKLDAQTVEAILQASAEQTGKMQKIRSWDSDYPVFEIPINQKVLVYVPNHVVQMEDGTLDLRKDKFAAHPIIDGNTFQDVRCVSGVVDEANGHDGTCPLCDALADVWKLYTIEYDSIAKARGIDPQSEAAKEGLKEVRKELIRKQVLKKADVWYTFPFVVIDCVEQNGVMTTTPKKDAEGKIHGTPMWYSIRESTYLEKWVAGFDSIETDDGATPTHPAGLWAILNFTYTPSSGKHDRMGSARQLKVTFKNMPGYEAWATYFDNLTEGWTPYKAMETVVLDSYRSRQELEEVEETLMRPVRDKIAVYQLSANARSGMPTLPVATPQDSADAVLSNYGANAMNPPEVADTVGEMPTAGVE